MMTELNDMTDEAYFGALKMLFNTEGWKIFMAELADNATSVNSVEDAKDQDDLMFRKGQLNILGNLLNMEDTIKRAEEDSTTAAIYE